jgi:hypothetical protein
MWGLHNIFYGGNTIMLTRSRRILLAVATLVTLGALTGCSATGSTVAAGSMPFAAPATATASATPTPTAIPGDENNDGKLSEFEKQILAKNAVRDYTMPDGSIVKIDPTQPLPGPVVAVLQAKSAATAEALKGDPDADAQTGARDAIYEAVRAEAAATGKQLVYVYQAFNETASSKEIVWASQPSGVKSTGLDVTPDKAAFMASVEAWANPRNYEIVVIQ